MCILDTRSAEGGREERGCHAKGGVGQTSGTVRRDDSREQVVEKKASKKVVWTFWAWNPV